MDIARVEDGGAPPSDLDGQTVVGTLVQVGRWIDAADYYRHCDAVDPRTHAALLIAAGRFDAAHSIIISIDFDRDWVHWDTFLRSADDALRGNAIRFPELISMSSHFAWHWATPIIMLRVSETLGRFEVAGKYAQIILAGRPWDVGAAAALALNLIERGEYQSAVAGATAADFKKRADEPSNIELVVAHLQRSGQFSAAQAFATIGYFYCKPKDSTKPVRIFRRETHQRWLHAYRLTGRRRRYLAWAAQWIFAAVCLGGSLQLFGTAAPGLVMAVLARVPIRARPIGGLDSNTSKRVRSLLGPWASLKSRHYSPHDTLIFLITLIVAVAIGSKLAPAGSEQVWAPVVLIGGVLLAALATRERRRYLQRRREAGMRPELDPAHCRCLEVTSVRGSESRDYVDNHLFDTGGVRLRPEWRVRQCLGTHTKFLDLPSAELTIKLPAPGLAEHSLL